MPKTVAGAVIRLVNDGPAKSNPRTKAGCWLPFAGMLHRRPRIPMTSIMGPLSHFPLKRTAETKLVILGLAAFVESLGTYFLMKMLSCLGVARIDSSKA